jgi:ABC-type transport system substrate-binding protein
MSIDPLNEEDHPASRDRLSALAFETLTDMDPLGRVRPKLASSWHSDQAKRVWQLRLRLANFHDGTLLTASDVVASLGRSNSAWKYTVNDRQTLTIEAPSPVTHMLELLALPKYAIVKRLPDSNAGTGPYRLSEWQAGERALFTINEDYWGGRAYPDAIEFQMGASLHDQLLERQLGKYAGAEVSVDQLRALEQANQNIALSHPADLLVISFLQPDSTGKPGRKPVDVHVREALSNAINRTAISDGLLRRRGISASGLLPQWLTGYEFMFPGGVDLGRARELRADAAAFVVITPIALAYDSSDPLAKLVAEKIQVDANAVGIVVQPYGELHINSKTARASLNADAVLLRLPLQSVEPSVALSALADDLGFSDNAPAILGATRQEDLFEVEHKIKTNYRVIPVAHLSQALWLSGSVHNWQQLANGAWQLDQLWVEGAR